MERKIIHREGTGSHHLLLIFNSNEHKLEYGSEEFDEFISTFDFESQNESNESKKQLISYLVASLDNLKNEEYFSKTVTQILSLFLTIDKNWFNISDEVLHPYIQNILNLYICRNDLNYIQHSVIISIFKVLIKFSIITEFSIQCFFDKGIYATISAIVGKTIDHLKTSYPASSFNIYETLNYSIYLLYKFSLITNVYTNNLDNQIVVMIQRTKEILNDYYLSFDYLSSHYYKTELIITCSLLCLFNNLVNKIAKKQFENIINPEMNNYLIKFGYKFLIMAINNTKNDSYKIAIENELEIENHEYVKYFNLVDVFKSLNRFSIFSSFLNSKSEYIVKEFNECIKELIVYHKIENFVNQDLAMLQIDNHYDGNVDLNIIEKVEYLMREKQFEQICSKYIVLYFKYLRIKSKDDFKSLEEKKDFLKKIFLNLIELMNKNLDNTEGLYNKTAIEHIIVLIRKILTESKILVEIVNYLFIVLLKLILRQLINCGTSIEAIKTNLDIQQIEAFFWAILRMQNDSSQLLDFEEIKDKNNFSLYLSELNNCGNVLTYNNQNFFRDLCLYLIIMIGGKIHIIFGERNTFFNIIKTLLERIFYFDCEFKEELMNSCNCSLTLFEIFGYMALVLPSFLLKYSTKNKLNEGQTVQIQKWIESFNNHVLHLTDIPEKNTLLSFKFTIKALHELIKKTVETENSLIHWKNENYEICSQLLERLNGFLWNK